MSHRQGVRARRKPASLWPTSSGTGATQQRAKTPTSTPLSTLGVSSGAMIVESSSTPLLQVAASEGAPTRVLWIGGLAVLLALTLAMFPSPEMVLASGAASMFASGLALRASLPALRDLGALSWALGPLGAACAAVSAMIAASAGGPGHRLGLASAALASAAMLARAYFDAEARRPIARAVHELLARMPTRVHVPVKDASDPLALAVERVEATKVRTGEEVLVQRGGVIAVDGIVQAGEASVLPYPGATTAIKRRIGDPLLAGATVQDGAVRVLATRVGDDRALVRIGRFGDPRERDSSPLLRLADDVARYGGAVALAVSLAVMVFGDVDGLTSPLSAAAAILVAAPLFSVRRATEWSLVGASATAGARGIVFQNGSALDLAGHVATVAMSPRRTLTEGKPEVLEVHFRGEGDENELLSLIASAEQASGNQHSIARAISAFTEARGIGIVDVRRAVNIPGRGVTALSPAGEEVIIGSRRLLLDHGVSIATADADAARAEAAGRTAIFVAVAGRVRAVITLLDHLRTGARAAVQRMFDMDLEVVLLTGDQRGPIEELAVGLDIAHVKADLLPEERAHEVRSLREAGGRVAVIGHPDEDDAPLAAADVGIALGAAGGRAGEKAIALVSEDVRDAAAALWIAQAARSGIVSALLLAAACFAVVVAAAATGFVEPGIAAVVTVLVDAYGVRAGARLLHRIALRLPAWT